MKDREAWIKSEEGRLKEEEARLSKLQAPMMTLVAKIKDREEALKKGRHLRGAWMAREKSCLCSG